MRIMAGGPPDDWMRYRVWHVPLCMELKDVVWVDDETHQWAHHVFTPVGFVSCVHQARKVLIKTQAKMVLIDPTEDQDEAEETDVGRLSQLPQPADA